MKCKMNGPVHERSKVGMRPRCMSDESKRPDVLTLKDMKTSSSQRAPPTSSTPERNGGARGLSNSRVYRHEDSIQSVSRALFRLIRLSGEGPTRTGNRDQKTNKTVRGSRLNPSSKTAFDIENFMKKTYIVAAPRFPIGCSIPCYAQRERQIVAPPPTVANIHAFIKLMFAGARLAPECMIVALIYIDRLSRGKRAVRLTERNWLPITMVALLTASKVWEDNPTWNGQFSELFPAIPVRGLNRLERAFHSQLQYNLHISGKTYSRYYFALRALTPNREAHLNRAPARTAKSNTPSAAAAGAKTKYYLKLASPNSGRLDAVRRSVSFAQMSSMRHLKKVAKCSIGVTSRRRANTYSGSILEPSDSDAQALQGELKSPSTTTIFHESVSMPGNIDQAT
mmetsp:Transcript_24368/g.33837  ORF Transcript_24368/g.33837 Transcript_24368/m.33837 type:complete len:396 (+) Transcript_24368:212-1399(+)|eukprot:jgi/Bigna1/87312/estExt_fgenesh1_pg.C_190030